MKHKLPLNPLARLEAADFLRECDDPTGVLDAQGFDQPAIDKHNALTRGNRLGMRSDNPVLGVRRFADGKRLRRLSDDEYATLGSALRQAVEELALDSAKPSGQKHIRGTKRAPVLCVGPSIAGSIDREAGSTQTPVV